MEVEAEEEEVEGSDVVAEGASVCGGMGVISVPP